MRRFALLFCLTGLSFTCRAEPIVHNYDLKHVLWKISVDMTQESLKGDVTNTVTFIEDAKSVQFDAADLVYSLVTVDGKPAQYDTKDDKLTVQLPNPAAEGQTVNVRAVYTVKPQVGFYFVQAYRAFPSKTGMVYTQGQGEDNHYWMPTYDYPDDKATTECYVTVPATWNTLSNGALVGVSSTGTSKVFHWKMDQPHCTYLISLVAGEYTEVRSKWRNTPVSYFVPPGFEKEGEASFGATPKMIEHFSKLTGYDYPYAKFSQAVVGDFLYGGMENTTAVTNTIRTLHRPDTEPVNDSTYLVAHELAHQWFGDAVTCRTWEHSWINEGFATTLPQFYNRSTHGIERFDLDRFVNHEGAIDTIGSRNRKEVLGAVGASPSVNVGSVYSGGNSRIMLLMHEMGEEVFWKAIATFLKRFEFQPVTTDDFFGVMNEVSGRDWTDFKKQWLYSSATPSLTVSQVGESLVVRQLQPYYTFELPIWVLDGEGWVKKTMHVSGGESKLTLGELAGKPYLVDPTAWTPMELRYETKFTDAEVVALYKNAPNVAQKARIVTYLFDTISVRQRIAIGHSENYYGLLQLIAPKIGKDGAWYLMELTRHSDPRVVNAAVQAVGALESNADFVARMREIHAEHSNESVRESAMRVLLAWSKDPADAAKAWGMKAFDDGYRVMAMDWWGRNETDKARAMALGFLAKPDSEPVRVAAINALAKAKDLPGEETVFNALVKVAKETSYAARCAAVSALGDLGNKKAILVLEPLAKRGPASVPGLAQQALAKLNN